MQHILTKDFLFRTLRVVLVFTLVFWSSFRIECLAFADVSADDLSKRAENGEKLTNVAVWQVTDPELSAGDRSVLVAKAGEVKSVPEDGIEKSIIRVNANSGKVSFVALPTWGDGEKEEFTVTYKDGIGGSLFSDEVHEKVEKGKPTPGFDGSLDRDGYTFDGWDPAVSETVEGDATYTAKWTEKEKQKYTVTYEDEFSPNGIYYTEEVEEGSDTPLVNDPTADGFDFKGWNPDPYGTTVTGNATYVAKWEAKSVEPDSDPVEPDPPVVDPDPVDPEPSGGNEGGTADNTADDATNDARSNPRPAPSPSITTMAENDVTIANFMKWELVKVEGSADISLNEKDGVATLMDTNNQPGKATVRCSPNGEAEGLTDPAVKPFVAEFKVQFVAVSSLEIYKSGTSDRIVGSKSKPLILGEDEREGYALDVKANASTLLNEDDAISFVSTPATSMKEASNNLLSDVTWSVFKDDGSDVTDDVASITQKGELTIKGEGSFLVRCSTPDFRDGQQKTEDVYVATGEVAKDDAVYQGEDHHQDKLTVKVQRPKVVLETADGHGGDTTSETQQQTPAGSENASAGASEGSAEGASEGSAATGENAKYEETLATYDRDLVNIKTHKQLDINEKDYSMTLPVKRGETTAPEQVTASGRGTTLALLLDDAGVTLEEQKNIDYIEFGNVEVNPTRVAWSDLVTASHAETSYIMVAKEAYVHEPASATDSGTSAESESSVKTEPSPRPAPAIGAMAEGDGSSDEAPASETPPDSGGNTSTPAEGGEQTTTSDPSGQSSQGDQTSQTDQGSGSAAPTNPFLPNTRFQIMFDQSDAAPALTAAMADLRWVNSITVHMKGAEEPEYVDGKTPWINYDAVPKGVTALMTAVPPTSIGSANFGYKWERSTDEGRTWQEVAGNTQQTIYVPTDDAHIGNYYRVFVILDEGTSKPSKAVQVREGNGFVVQLDYVPPFAGDWANFTSHIIGADENDPNIKYRWEQSTDGCQTWTEIPNEAGKTLRVKTNPIAANSGDSGSGEGGDGGDAGATVLTYIRVVAILGSDSGVSGPQLLTVRVGDDPNGKDSTEKDGNQTDPKANDVQDALNNKDKNPQELDTESTDTEPTDAEPDDFDEVETSGTQVIPLDVDYDDFDDEEVEAIEPASKASTEPAGAPAEQTAPEPAADISKVIVDDSVSEKIREMNNKQKEQSDATPGARWTEISAVNPSSDDVRRVLAGNPFAPLAGPFALGLTAAGVVEKLFAFRRQIR